MRVLNISFFKREVTTSQLINFNFDHCICTKPIRNTAQPPFKNSGVPLLPIVSFIQVSSVGIQTPLQRKRSRLAFKSPGNKRFRKPDLSLQNSLSFFFLAEYPAGLERNHNLCSAQQMILQSRSSSYCINIPGSLREEKIAKIKAQHVVFRRCIRFLIAISFLYSLFFPPSGVSLGSSCVNSNNLHQ